jgi:hypothetical protein
MQAVHKRHYGCPNHVAFNWKLRSRRPQSSLCAVEWWERWHTGAGQGLCACLAGLLVGYVHIYHFYCYLECTAGASSTWNSNMAPVRTWLSFPDVDPISPQVSSLSSEVSGSRIAPFRRAILRSNWAGSAVKHHPIVYAVNVTSELPAVHGSRFQMVAKSHGRATQIPLVATRLPPTIKTPASFHFLFIPHPTIQIYKLHLTPSFHLDSSQPSNPLQTMPECNCGGNCQCSGSQAGGSCGCGTSS